MKVNLERYYYDEAHDLLIFAGCVFPFATAGLGIIVKLIEIPVLSDIAKVVYALFFAFIAVRWCRLRILAAKQTRILNNGNKNKHDN